MTIDHKYVSSPNDLPPGEHYAIIFFNSQFIPGDERSRTHPGHGYPAETVVALSCAVYNTAEAWRSAIAALTTSDDRRRQNWVPLIVRRPIVKTDVKVDVT